MTVRSSRSTRCRGNVHRCMSSRHNDAGQDALPQPLLATREFRPRTRRAFVGHDAGRRQHNNCGPEHVRSLRPPPGRQGTAPPRHQGRIAHKKSTSFVPLQPDLPRRSDGDVESLMSCCNICVIPMPRSIRQTGRPHPTGSPHWFTALGHRTGSPRVGATNSTKRPDNGHSNVPNAVLTWHRRQRQQTVA